MYEYKDLKYLYLNMDNHTIVNSKTGEIYEILDRESWEAAKFIIGRYNNE